MSNMALLIMLRRYRFLYVAIFVVAFVVGWYSLKPEVVRYESSTTFYHTNESMDSPVNFSQNGSKIIYLQDPVQERLYQITYSTEMLDYLIREFDLYKHYGIDSSGLYHYERVINEISSNVSFNRNTPDLFTIFVYDNDREFAAKLANSLVVKLDLLNKKYLINKLQTNLTYYEAFLKESEKLSAEQNKLLLFYVDKLKNPSQKTSGDISSTPKTELEYSFYQAAASIDEVTTQLMIAKALYSKAVMTQQSNELPSLVIIRQAFPDPKSKTILLCVFSALTGLLVCIVLFIVMYFWIAFPNEIKILFGNGQTPG